MEEWVGTQWHRFATRMAGREHAEATVELEEVARTIALLFRAGGGAGAVRVVGGSRQAVGGPRGFWQRISGSGTEAHLARIGEETLELPPYLAVLPERARNRDLYLWLAALSASWHDDDAGAERADDKTGDERADDKAGDDRWIPANLRASKRALQRFPGLAQRHAQLAQAQLAQRPALATLHGAARDAEAAVQAALRGEALPPGAAQVQIEQVQPVWLWTQAAASSTSPARAPDDTPGRGEAPPRAKPTKRIEGRRRGERTDDTSSRAGMILMFRAESLLSWGEFVKVNRATDDDPDDDPGRVADDLDRISLAEGGETLASRVRFDLDLPSAAQDDTPLGEPEMLPEWNHRRGVLMPDHCAVQRFSAHDAGELEPPPALRALAKRMRRRIETLRPERAWRRGAASGDELDLDAWVRHRGEALAHAAAGTPEPSLYRSRERIERGLATLLLADLSLSTDAHATSSQRVIDVIRDALFVFGEALDGLGDPFEILGFSSVRRQHVRIHELKRFDDAWNARARRHVGGIKPGYYTRMGAAIRHATQRLSARPEPQRLLLLLSDGKPNDLDAYEGRHGLEDTRHAVQAARRAGLVPFCVTIDEEAHQYLPYLFGSNGHAHVRRPHELATRLALLYATLTR